MDHHLIAFARSPGVHSVVQRRLGDEGERVRFPLLEHRRRGGTVLVSRFRGTVHERRSRGTGRDLLRACSLMQRLPRRRDCLDHHGAGLRLEPRADDDHAVIIVIEMHGAVFVPPRRLFDFHLAIHPTPAANDPLDVLSRAGQADLEQSLFDLWCRDPRQRSDLRV